MHVRIVSIRANRKNVSVRRLVHNVLHIQVFPVGTDMSNTVALAYEYSGHITISLISNAVAQVDTKTCWENAICF